MAGPVTRQAAIIIRNETGWRQKRKGFGKKQKSKENSKVSALLGKF
jgi:hypothetical protein